MKTHLFSFAVVMAAIVAGACAGPGAGKSSFEPGDVKEETGGSKAATDDDDDTTTSSSSSGAAQAGDKGSAALDAVRKTLDELSSKIDQATKG